jgi:hypothetical protein
MNIRNGPKSEKNKSENDNMNRKGHTTRDSAGKKQNIN